MFLVSMQVEAQVVLHVQKYTGNNYIELCNNFKTIWIEAVQVV